MSEKLKNMIKNLVSEDSTTASLDLHGFITETMQSLLEGKKKPKDIVIVLSGTNEDLVKQLKADGYKKVGTGKNTSIEDDEGFDVDDLPALSKLQVFTTREVEKNDVNFWDDVKKMIKRDKYED